MTEEATIPAMRAGSPPRDNPLTRSVAGVAGLVTLVLLVVACLGSLPWTVFGTGEGRAVERYRDQVLEANRLPPTWLMDLPEDWAEPAVWGDPGAKARDRVVAGYHAAAVSFALSERVAEAGEGEEEVSAEDLTVDEIRSAAPYYVFGTDNLGRDLFVRSLAGGAVSIGIGLSAAGISVLIGTLYGALAGYLGGKADAVLMRIVDVLYGLPYILLVVLLAVAGDALVSRYDSDIKRESAERRWVWMLQEAGGAERAGAVDAGGVLLEVNEGMSEGEAALVRAANGAIRGYLGEGDGGDVSARELVEAVSAVDRDLGGLDPLLVAKAGGEEEASAIKSAATVAGFETRGLSSGTVTALEVLVLLLAIGGVSWLTMARVIRGQVLSLKERPFMEAARAMGVPVGAQFRRHLLPNLVGPIVVYATLTVPQAILQESFLSFLGIGVKPPLPSWGNLAAEGLTELNGFASAWWRLFFPCLLLALTLLALNFVGEGLREAFDPKRARK